MKTNYLQGETVTVRIISDNTNCDKPVERVGIKFSLRAKITGFEIWWGTSYTSELRLNLLEV
jgi:hypothetical protein